MPSVQPIPPREQTYKNESLMLSPYAFQSINASGRRREETPCPIRTDFQRDRDRIIHCGAFRRLKHKTQVFLIPKSDHYRTRLTHTLEVAQIARTVARALRLNEDLTEAIALGHDRPHAFRTRRGKNAERTLRRLQALRTKRKSLRSNRTGRERSKSYPAGKGRHTLPYK